MFCYTNSIMCRRWTGKSTLQNLWHNMINSSKCFLYIQQPHSQLSSDFGPFSGFENWVPSSCLREILIFKISDYITSHSKLKSTWLSLLSFINSSTQTVGGKWPFCTGGWGFDPFPPVVTGMYNATITVLLNKLLISDGEQMFQMSQPTCFLHQNWKPLLITCADNMG